jgi:hypothetical protein
MWHHMIHFRVAARWGGRRQFDLFLSLSVCLLCSNALYYALRPMILRWVGGAKGEVSETTPMFHLNCSVQE